LRKPYFPITLNLNYRLKNDLETLSEPALFVESNEVDLRFRLALGDLILTTPQADFSTRWGWVPLIDFAVSVQEIIDDLRRGVHQARFEFTESEATLTFSRNEDELVITASYAPGRIEIPLTSFAERLRQFKNDLRADLVKAHPVLDTHPVFNRLLPRGA
jgi:hypothetical protein